MKPPRDMTRAEFSAALKRRGWSKVLLWIEIGDQSVGMVMVNRGSGYKINRRASLAAAIRAAESPRP